MSVRVRKRGYGEYPYDQFPYDTPVRTAAVSGQVVLEPIENFKVGCQVEFTRFTKDTPWILVDFPSRGSGRNWTASSTAPGHFKVDNLNSDIVQKYWRSADEVKEDITLTCDTGVSQGVFIDTIGIFGTNLTSSAVITVRGQSDDSLIPEWVFQLRANGSDRIIWTADSLPSTSYRNLHFEISDPTNRDPFIKIGTLIFGSAIKLENKTDEQPKIFHKEFKDEIKTLGFTTISNSKAYTKGLRVNFRDFNLSESDYKKISYIFSYLRTSLKGLWIFDPSTELTKDIYSVFAKMKSIPDERHRVMGKEGEDMHLDFSLELDESL